MAHRKQVRTYDPAVSIVFLKTKERFGGLSNMAPGFPLKVNGIRIRTSEALYQACRFPHRPDVQRQIIEERSPMTAKMRSKPFLEETRSDWDAVRVNIMRWCLRVKLAQNWCEFGRLLRATAGYPIVEQSRKDDFWGAKAIEDGTLLGMNVLGRLLMELREQLYADTFENLKVVKPLSIPEFLLCQKPIETVRDAEVIDNLTDIESRQVSPTAGQKPYDPIQPSLFDQPTDVQVRSKIPGVSSTMLEPYPLYRHSGVPWLDRVPRHWEVKRLGQFGTFSKGRGGNREDEVSAGIPCIRYGDLYTTHRYFIQRSRSFISRMTAKDYTPIKYGDVLFAASGETIEEIGKSSVSLIQSETYCGGDVILFRPNREVEARFMGYATNCKPAANQKSSLGRGITVIHIYTDQLKRLSLALPPLPEQAAIIRYLDHADRHIQRYIHAKQRLLSLLEEQKQATIHQAVLGQTDVRTGKPYQAYKPSGVEWLEDVPDHWSIGRVKRLARIQGGYAFSTNDFESEGTPIVRMQNIHRGVLKLCDSVRIPEHLCKSEYSLKAGDILYGLSGSIGETGSLGNYAVVTNTDLPAQLNQRIGRLQPIEYRLDKGFLVHCLCTSMFYEQVLSVTSGTAQFNVSTRDIGNVFLVLPPLPEQTAIARYLDEVTADIDTAKRCTHHQIELIKEYRTRLISDVVTGKLDVREAAANLPNDTALMDAMDDPSEKSSINDVVGQVAG